MICGKCGARIPDGGDVCLNCGAKIGAAKKVMSIIVAFIALVIAAGAILLVNLNTKKNGFYENLAWGTDIDTAFYTMSKKCPETGSLMVTDSETIVGRFDDYKGIKGITWAAVFKFENNATLSSVVLMYTISDDCAYTPNKLANEIKAEYTKLYGEPDDIEGRWYEWSTKKSIIKLADSQDGYVIIAYSPLD